MSTLVTRKRVEKTDFHVIKQDALRGIIKKSNHPRNNRKETTGKRRMHRYNHVNKKEGSGNYRN